jgi:hypothetical protein
MRRRRPRLVEGLADGAASAGLATLGEGIGEGLGWLSGGELAIAQPCPIKDCPNGTFSSLRALRNHLEIKHAYMTPRERTEACDTARILCRKAVATARSLQ